MDAILTARSGGLCELCGASAGVTAVAIAPRAEDAALCAVCAAQASGAAPLDAAHLACLQESAWTQAPAPQVAAFRLLTRLSREQAASAPWAADLLDQLFLEDDVRAWADAEAAPSGLDAAPAHRDCNGAVLANGDTVTLIKDLPVKGAGFTAKRGAAVRNISLAPDNPEHIEGRVEGQRIVILTRFVKKSG